MRSQHPFVGVLGWGQARFWRPVSLSQTPKQRGVQTHLSKHSVGGMGEEQAPVSEGAAEENVQRVRMGLHRHTEGHLPRLQQKEALVSSGRLFSLSGPQFPQLCLKPCPLRLQN